MLLGSFITLFIFIIATHSLEHVKRAPPVPTVPPSEGSLRLVNGSRASDGRLEVYHSGQWGTVCDDDFNAEEAAVACKQLGYNKPPYMVVDKAGYGEGKGQIFLDDVVCNGSETRLTQCHHTAWSGGNCLHYEDVGLNCRSANQIRLADGWKYTEGRVEVYHNGKWGTVCDDSFDANEALVICNTLGYTVSGVTPKAYTHAHYGQGSEPTWLDNMKCTGSESSFFSCNHPAWGHENCNHGEDAGVDCTPGVRGNASEVKLFDGWKRSEGRIEVYHSGQRGTVCDDNFGATEAAIVCKMLGYSGTNAVAKPGGFYGGGQNRILLDDVDCQGNEASIFLCQHSTFGISDCQHDEDVGVDCDPGSPAGTLNRTDLRLAGGSRPSEGRLELLHEGEWGSVCDSSFDTSEATVVCRMLGYTGSAAGVRSRAYYGAGSGRIWFDHLSCFGNETNLLDCQHRIGSRCNHNQDVGVDCDPGNDGNSSTIRLVNGSRPNAGRVEVYHNNQWGTICDHNFGANEAKVICEMLGFHNSVYGGRRAAYYGEGKGQVWLDYANCTGKETSFFQCRHYFWGNNRCSHRQDAGVDCNPNLEGNASTIRLANGWKKSEGRVEVFHKGQWGTVCSSRFYTKEAQVICRMLGYNNTTPLARGRAYYGQGKDPSWIRNLDCKGSEKSMFECALSGWGQGICRHSYDVGVDCDSGSSAQSVNVSDFRLVNGSRPTNGRLEIFHNGQWGSACMTDWDEREAEVVCRMLNMSRNGTTAVARNGAYYGAINGPVWIDNIRCSGIEANLLDCSHSQWGRRTCDHKNDVGVDCAPESEGNSSTIRLVGGSRPSQGRLEVFHNGEWGTVCDDNFEIKEAKAACKVLGYKGDWVQAKGAYGEGRGRIWLDELNCQYDSPSLFACDHVPWGRTDCAHGEDVGIDCRPDLDGNRTTLRLVNGSKPANGRLEVLHNGVWGSVCNHGWDNTATEIACRTLGYKDAYVTHSSGNYGHGTGKIWLDDFACKGNEISLFVCQHSTWGFAACDHNDDVDIECDPVPDLNTRIVDGPNKYSGRVEVKINGKWGTICNNRFDSNEANVICRMFNYRRGGSVAALSTYPEGKGPIHLNYLSCRGTELSIFACRSSSAWSCRHSQDAGVECLKGCLYNADCENNGTCRADHTCQCAIGWVGEYCTSFVGPNGDCHVADACPVHSKCVPGNNTHINCVCDTGYQPHNLHCIDIDECARGHACPSMATCHNIEGDFECQCPIGFTYKGGNCTDVNECLDSHACPVRTVCSNTVGSYKCTCAQGFRQDALFCVDIDECAGTASCSAHSHCVNEPGRYRCDCDTGYTKQNNICTAAG